MYNRRGTKSPYIWAKNLNSFSRLGEMANMVHFCTIFAISFFRGHKNQKKGSKNTKNAQINPLNFFGLAPYIWSKRRHSKYCIKKRDISPSSARGVFSEKRHMKYCCFLTKNTKKGKKCCFWPLILLHFAKKGRKTKVISSKKKKFCTKKNSHFFPKA